MVARPGLVFLLADGHRANDRAQAQSGHRLRRLPEGVIGVWVMLGFCPVLLLTRYRSRGRPLDSGLLQQA